ncbi:amyloid fiber anchoring/assembly protein TapA [Bacillus nakamurai]|uniref:amyloid fiber anchoring/assembly protein TapA n=1 Tax=Bacillus nakamurai TaxID=1793963 RepID=UPI0007785A79|nr:amyloid fiber anchoring/assembly protein TapA [Bacillus nakamurai]KXZ23062.1 amyloid fiber anchoring/assembly protein TapA [Bacillus nakamurai]
MFRLFRTEKEAKTRWRILFFFQLSFIFSLAITICAQFTDDTSSSFNDVRSFSLPIETCGDFRYTDDNCRYDERWDQSDLYVTNQTDTAGTVCAPVHLYVELENKGEKQTISEWKWELHKIPSSHKPLQNGNVIDRGLVTDKKSDLLYRVESKRALQPGIYAFKIYKPEGYPANEEKFEWSEPMKLVKCQEKPTASSVKKAEKEPSERQKERGEENEKNDETDQ